MATADPNVPSPSGAAAAASGMAWDSPFV
jgi:hypothetical protein